MMESSSFQPNVRRTTMKMASMSLVSVFLLSCLAVTSISSQDPEYTAVGRNHTVKLGNLTLTSTDTLKWWFNGKVLFHRKSKVIIIGGKDDINAEGSLKLTNLKKDQEGDYTAEVYDGNGIKRNTKKTKLIVLDPVNKPTIKILCNDKTAKFECVSTKPPRDIKYEWLKNNVKLGKEVQGKLEVKLKEAKDNTFSCKVFNEATNAISEPVSRSCLEKGPLGLLDEDLEIWVLIGGGSGIVFLLILIVIICFIQTKRRRRLRLKDEDELRLAWTSNEQHKRLHDCPPLPDHPPPPHPNRHNHSQQQQQAPGHTGPRQGRSNKNRQPRPRVPEPNGQPQPSPRRTVQAKKPDVTDEEQPPPLPQPRKKAPKGQVE
ncbi:T-cell surface antigen CD2-like [Cyprinodon tularosa]|uniref:T-cell surface antigen CD2-like n=1 Tax=Cyprinodon tularosa TaxID=77115 RepID=UPI0018E2527B|nr:T-cell surface antigen CD2-like [Cyprinodon tularosa]